MTNQYCQVNFLKVRLVQVTLIQISCKLVTFYYIEFSQRYHFIITVLKNVHIDARYCLRVRKPWILYHTRALKIMPPMKVMNTYSTTQRCHQLIRD